MLDAIVIECATPSTTRASARSGSWVACWEAHMVATLAALMRRAYAAGRESVMHPNCNHNWNQETETLSR